ncbi:thiol:disulfide interchange protein precursor [Polystyrenella longa]|uniref:Thiol:disulfide interchange protein n=1 Tax=Polystyrenella longa TaxID=2528007 RepID=A0A518CQM9_9PLAN|nr:DUF255 domain-containing protein [Polystyrenella longa]QDU81523.1 thiol:disulfide interchange protein precursor [Polystyrenella longa]
MASKRFQLYGIIAGSLVYLSCFAGTLQAQVQWRSSLKEVAQESRETGKPMLLKFTAEWCTFCHKMEKSFNKPEVSAMVNEHFIPIKVDADEKKNLVEEIGVSGFPTTVIISPDFQVLQKITGYLKEDELHARLEVMCPPEPAGRVIVQKQTKPEVPVKKAVVPENPIQQVASEWAFEQICLVQLVENGQLTPGNPAFRTIYRDKQLCFVSAAHKQAFEHNPEHYWPAVNGNCPIVLSEDKQAVSGSPELGAIYRGKLWFFSTPEARQHFADAPQQYLLPGVIEPE